MNETIFKSFTEPKKPTKKWLFFSLSLLLHGLVIGAVIMVPLMTADTGMPHLKIHTIIPVAPPTPPAAPPAAARAKTSSKGTQRTPKGKKSKPITTGRIVLPIDVPSDIAEENIEDWGIDGGVEGGVDVVQLDDAAAGALGQFGEQRLVCLQLAKLG